MAKDADTTMSDSSELHMRPLPSHPPLPDQTQCAVCGEIAGLSTCDGCKVTSYCSRQHQTEDWFAHKTVCKPIKSARAAVQAEEKKQPAGIFQSQHGNLGQPSVTKSYMLARLNLVTALVQNTNTNIQIESRVAVESALQHAHGMLQLDHADRIEVRQLMHAMYLRLGRDQECYDFIKFFHRATQDVRRDSFEKNAPFLNLAGENPFESNIFSEIGSAPVLFQLVMNDIKPKELSPMVSFTLIKIRLLLDLRRLQDVLRDCDSSEESTTAALNNIRGKLLTDVLRNDEDFVAHISDAKGLDKPLHTLDEQIGEMYDMVVERNEHFWCRLIFPINGTNLNFLTTDPKDVCHDCPGCGEIAEVLQANYKFWLETKGALKVIRAHAARDETSCAFVMGQKTGTLQHILMEKD